MNVLYVCVVYTLYTQGSYFFFIWYNSPPVGQGLLIHEVSKSHTMKHYSRLDSSG
jgi:hypothetical protein